MKRFRNKAFLVSLFSSILLLVQQLGFDFLPNNIEDIFNTVLVILTMVGITVDPTTPTLKD